MIVNVCGAGSSGTTFLAAMLDRHPRIACGDELYLFNKPLLYRSFGRLRRLRRLFRAHGLSASPQHPDRSLLRNLEGFGLDPDRVWRWVAECPTIEALAARFHAHIRALTGKPVWAEKTPSNSRTATLFARHFPADRVIHLVRDPRDQALSRMRRGVDLDTAAWIWLTAVAAIQPLRGSDRLLELRYEDLALDFDAQMLRICKFLGLPCEPHWFHLDTHVSHGLSRSSGHVSWQSTAKRRPVRGLHRPLLRDHHRVRPSALRAPVRALCFTAGNSVTIRSQSSWPFTVMLSRSRMCGPTAGAASFRWRPLARSCAVSIGCWTATGPVPPS